MRFHNISWSTRVVTDVASVRQDSPRQDSLKHRLSYRAPCFEPKTDARLTEARTSACAFASLRLERTSAWARIYWKLHDLWNLIVIRYIIDCQLDSNPVYDEYNNRHFEIHQYTNCD